MTDYLTTEYLTLETELGTFLLWSNGEGTDENGRKVDTYGVRTEHNPPRGFDGEVSEYVTVNRVDWHFHGFGTLDRETGEVLTTGKPGITDARRVDWKEASWESREKAETKIYAAIRPALEAFAKSDEGRAWLSRARYFDANNDVHRYERELAELDAKRAEVKRKIAAARKIMTANPI